MKEKRASKFMNKFGFFARLMASLAEASEAGTNKAKVYAAHGYGGTNPIYFPQRKKLKGFQKDHRGRKIKK